VKLNDASIQTTINSARVARLSTVDCENMPHTVPVVFAFDGHHYYIPLDGKGKTQPVEKLKRVRNIQQNPNVALLIDEYNEDWGKLFFVMIQGKAYLIGDREEKGNQNNDYDFNYNFSLKEIHKLLYQKYPQYRQVGIGWNCIKIQPQKTISWKNYE
jgi:PPOX class probable F420-dependent enzyme